MDEYVCQHNADFFVGFFLQTRWAMSIWISKKRWQESADETVLDCITEEVSGGFKAHFIKDPALVGTDRFGA